CVRNSASCGVSSKSMSFTLCRVARFQLTHQAVFPAALRAEIERKLARALVEEVTIRFPGEADTAVDLHHLLRGVIECLRGGDTRSSGRQRQFTSIGGERPRAIVRV